MQLAITGLGLISPIGHDVATACASYRAGITRPVELPNTVYSFDDLNTVSVTGYPIKGVTDGFAGLGLYLLLSQRVLQDLSCYTGINFKDPAFSHDSALFVCISPSRCEGFEAYDPLLQEGLSGAIVESNCLCVTPEYQKVFLQGNASVLFAIKSAGDVIREGRIKRVIILAIDSLVGKATVAAIHDQGRLKTPTDPHGLIPGEAAGALLVESLESAERREARIESLIQSVYAGKSDIAFIDEEYVSTGAPLANSIRKTMSGREKIKTIYCDLNGESWRASEWGNALVALSRTCHIETAAIHAPAECFGDTGAASGAVSICSAVRAFVGKYAEDSACVVASVSETGHVASALLIHPEAMG